MYMAAPNFPWWLNITYYEMTKMYLDRHCRDAHSHLKVKSRKHSRRTYLSRTCQSSLAPQFISKNLCNQYSILLSLDPCSIFPSFCFYVIYTYFFRRLWISRFWHILLSRTAWCIKGRAGHSILRKTSHPLAMRRSKKPCHIMFKEIFGRGRKNE